MNSETTRGPWVLSFDDRPRMAWNIHIVHADDPDMRVCFMAAPSGNAEALEAEAHLIAAAPELYEALLKARDDIALNGGVHGDATLDAIDAALAKARGES